jgi:hypothetical protein
MTKKKNVITSTAEDLEGQGEADQLLRLDQKPIEITDLLLGGLESKPDVGALSFKHCSPVTNKTRSLCYKTFLLVTDAEANKLKGFVTGNL